jgi:hypothetical protein
MSYENQNTYQFLCIWRGGCQLPNIDNFLGHCAEFMVFLLLLLNEPGQIHFAGFTFPPQIKSSTDFLGQRTAIKTLEFDGEATVIVIQNGGVVEGDSAYLLTFRAAGDKFHGWPVLRLVIVDCEISENYAQPVCQLILKENSNPAILHLAVDKLHFAGDRGKSGFRRRKDMKAKAVVVEDAAPE